MFTRTEIEAVRAEARKYSDAYIEEHMGYLNLELEKHDSYKSISKRQDCWRKVELEARLLLKRFDNLRNLTKENGGNGVQ